MRLALLEYLRCPVCLVPWCGEGARVDAYRTEGGSDAVRIEEAAVYCGACGRWFRVEDAVLDLLPDSLRDGARCAEFARRHGLSQDRGGEGAAPSAATDAALGLKQGQKAFFEGDVSDYEADVVGHPYYQALDAHTAHCWIAGLSPGSRVLDLCAGTGRITLPLAQAGHHVIALDIADAMLRESRRRNRAAGVEGEVDYILGDAECPPLADGAVDAVLCYGGLHHLPRPASCVAEAGRVLRPGGRWYSLDPHRSPMRWAFDLAMAVRRLWVEEASNHPLQDEASLRRWCAAAGIDAKVQFSTYLLPHLFSGMHHDTALRWLARSDRWLRDLPVIKRWAGVICVSGVKRRG